MKSRGRKADTSIANLKTVYTVNLTPEQFEFLNENFNLSLKDIDVNVIERYETLEFPKKRAKRLKIIDLLFNEPNLTNVELSRRIGVTRQNIFTHYNNLVKGMKKGIVIPITQFFE